MGAPESGNFGEGQRRPCTTAARKQKVACGLVTKGEQRLFRLHFRALFNSFTQGGDIESRLRVADEQRARLEADIDTLATTTAKLQAELKSVYRRWGEDGQRWAADRRRLQDKCRAQADVAASMANGQIDEAVGVRRSPTQPRGKSVEELVKERDTILKNWSEETEILVCLACGGVTEFSFVTRCLQVTIWKQDKKAWAEERQNLQRKVRIGLVAKLETQHPPNGRCFRSKS